MVIGWIKGRALCVTGKHHRSMSRAHRPKGSDRYESVCSYCGVPMVRIEKRNWVVKKQLADDA